MTKISDFKNNHHDASLKGVFIFFSLILFFITIPTLIGIFLYRQLLKIYFNFTKKRFWFATDNRDINHFVDNSYFFN